MPVRGATLHISDSWYFETRQSRNGEVVNDQDPPGQLILDAKNSSVAEQRPNRSLSAIGCWSPRAHDTDVARPDPASRTCGGCHSSHDARTTRLRREDCSLTDRREEARQVAEDAAHPLNAHLAARWFCADSDDRAYGRTYLGPRSATSGCGGRRRPAQRRLPARPPG